MTGKITGPLREQSDWEQQDENRLGFIKNKPFYDNRNTVPLTIEWDGVIGDKELVQLGVYSLYKMSDEVPTLAELNAGTITICENGEFVDYPCADSIMEIPEDGLYAYTDSLGFFVIYRDSVYEGKEIKKGTYFVFVEGIQYTSKLYLPSYTTGELKTIDLKYLPNTPKILDCDTVVGTYDGQEMSLTQVFGLVISEGGNQVNLKNVDASNLYENTNEPLCLKATLGGTTTSFVAESGRDIQEDGKIVRTYTKLWYMGDAYYLLNIMLCVQDGGIWMSVNLIPLT